MTKYRTFIDSESSIGQETILSIQTNGSEYGIGISSTTESENLIALNSVGIGTTFPQSNLHILRQVNPSLPPQSSIVIKLDSSNSSGTYINYSLNNGSEVYAGNSGGSFTVAKTLPGAPLEDVQFNVVGNADISGVTTLGLTNSSSPSTNSSMSFELTNNTTLTIRVKGTDGVVRTGTVTLS